MPPPENTRYITHSNCSCVLSAPLTDSTLVNQVLIYCLSYIIPIVLVLIVGQVLWRRFEVDCDEFPNYLQIHLRQLIWLLGSHCVTMSRSKQPGAPSITSSSAATRPKPPRPPVTSWTPFFTWKDWQNPVTACHGLLCRHSVTR